MSRIDQAEMVCLICLSRIGQALKGCLICLSRIDDPAQANQAVRQTTKIGALNRSSCSGLDLWIGNAWEVFDPDSWTRIVAPDSFT